MIKQKFLFYKIFFSFKYLYIFLGEQIYRSTDQLFNRSTFLQLNG